MNSVPAGSTSQFRVTVRMPATGGKRTCGWRRDFVRTAPGYAATTGHPLASGISPALLLGMRSSAFFIVFIGCHKVAGFTQRIDPRAVAFEDRDELCHQPVFRSCVGRRVCNRLNKMIRLLAIVRLLLRRSQQVMQRERRSRAKHTVFRRFRSGLGHRCGRQTTNRDKQKYQFTHCWNPKPLGRGGLDHPICTRSVYCEVRMWLSVNGRYSRRQVLSALGDAVSHPPHGPPHN